jgi:hypothetical protein
LNLDAVTFLGTSIFLVIAQQPIHLLGRNAPELSLKSLIVPPIVWLCPFLCFPTGIA